MANINIQADPRKPIDIVLIGKPYRIKPPKTAAAIKLAELAEGMDERDFQSYMDAVFSWINAAFGKKTPGIRKRLDDPDDDLDISHLTELMKQVTELTTGNPTTSASDSSESE